MDGLIGFVFGLLAAWIQHRFKRERRSLNANIESFSLLSLPDVIRDQVDVMFSGKVVDNIKVHRIHFWNSGNKVIANHRVEIQTGNNEEILSIDTGDRFRGERQENQAATVRLEFLNPSESEEITIHTTGEAEQEITIKGEGPGVTFSVAKRVSPIIDPNADPKNFRRRLFHAILGGSKKRIIWAIVIYVILFSVWALVLYLGQLTSILP